MPRFKVREPASGPLESILGLPGLGALSADVGLQGARDAERLSLVLSAGNLRASAEGSVDLRRYSADLKYALEASAMSPRADIAWRRIALNGRWLGSVSAPSADGRLEIDGLQLAGGHADRESERAAHCEQGRRLAPGDHRRTADSGTAAAAACKGPRID